MRDTFNLVPIHLVNNSPLLIINDNIINSQSGNPRGSDAIGVDRGDYEWWFVLPNEITENTTHTWEEYESMATRLSQKLATLHHGVSQIKQMGQNITNISTDGGRSPAAWLERNAHMLTDTQLANTLNYRVDSALMYKNSARREITFTLQLADYFINSSRESANKKIYEAVRKLQELSCPADTGGAYRLEFPRIFEVYTEGQWDSPMIYMRYAALTAVQPTWKSPYIKTEENEFFPQMIDLQLTFKDLKPLFRHNFNTGGRTDLIGTE